MGHCNGGEWQGEQVRPYRPDEAVMENCGVAHAVRPGDHAAVEGLLVFGAWVWFDRREAQRAEGRELAGAELFRAALSARVRVGGVMLAALGAVVPALALCSNTIFVCGVRIAQLVDCDCRATIVASVHSLFSSGDSW